MKGFWVGLFELFGTISILVATLKFPWSGPAEGTLEESVRACFWMLFGIAWHIDAIMLALRRSGK